MTTLELASQATKVAGNSAIKQAAKTVASKTTGIVTSIAIIIVNYNTREHLRRCLSSIDRDDADEIIVIDNASRDGSVEMVREQFPYVTLIARADNIGYGAAANEAIAGCTAEAILLLNSDTVLQNQSARALQSYLDDHPQAAIAGPRLHNTDGSLQPSCYPRPTPFFLFLEESLIGRLVAYIPGLRHYYLRSWRHDQARVVPWVLGAALAIRRSAFMEAGGFDPEYFMYFEEIDLCHRLSRLGWQTHFAPVTTLIHAGGASTSQRYAEMQVRLFQSTLLFYRRHYSSRQLRLLRLSMIGITAARLLRDLLRVGRAATKQEQEKSLATLKVRYRMLCDCFAAFAF